MHFWQGERRLFTSLFFFEQPNVNRIYDKVYCHILLQLEMDLKNWTKFIFQLNDGVISINAVSDINLSETKEMFDVYSEVQYLLMMI